MGARAVLFDIGNVVVRWDPRTLYSKIFPDPAERDRFLAEVCTMDWHLHHDRGRDMAEGIAERIALFPHHAAAITAWRERWWEMFSGVIPETGAAIEALHARGVPLYGLTNMPVEVFDGVMAMAPVLGRLRDIVVSGLEGCVKPEPRIYAIACERAGLKPRDFLFLDDNRANIEAAAALGFDVHLFDNPAALQPALQKRGLVD